MCKTSKEIQNKWQQKPGDFFADMTDKISFWTQKSSDSVKIKNGFKIEKENKLIKIEKYFWLPNLDQLMEAAQVKSKSFRDTSFAFFEWTKEAYSADCKPADAVFKSLEQLWLGYIMEKQFRKKWINNSWEKI